VVVGILYYCSPVFFLSNIGRFQFIVLWYYWFVKRLWYHWGLPAVEVELLIHLMLTWDAVCNQRISKRYGENGFDGGGASVSTGQRMLLIYLLID